MAATTAYVRFLRGTPAAFEKVLVKDPDTLYFISEVGADTGDLYLGHKLIAGKSALVKMSLDDLTNVIIDSVVDSGSLLVYDEDQGKWVNKTPDEIASEIYYQMQGATSDTNGRSGFVPVPRAGQQNLFLRGDATWADPTADLNATLNTLIAQDGGLSIREIAVDVLETALIPENAKESLDSLKEIADWIQSHPDDASAFNSRILNLEQTVFDVTNEEGDTISFGLVTTVGNLSTELNKMNTTVDNLKTDVRDVEKNISILYDRLKWHEMDENITT